jgi:hypothetical protein
VLVVILDGWGVNHEDQYNAVFSADTPCTDALKAAPRRYRSVRAHGTAVGLPSDADMGNSEVGHNALGSGQVIDQGARLVDQALANGQMFELPGWKLISQAFAQHTVHFIGLLSDGGVHSRYDQLVGCVTGAVERGAKRVRVHILTGVCVRGCHAWGGKRGVWSQQARHGLGFACVCVCARLRVLPPCAAPLPLPPADSTRPLLPHTARRRPRRARRQLHHVCAVAGRGPEEARGGPPGPRRQDRKRGRPHDRDHGQIRGAQARARAALAGISRGGCPPARGSARAYIHTC